MTTELKPLSSSAGTATKEAFVRGPKVVKTAQIKVHKMSDVAEDRAIKILAYGDTGSGKTRGLLGLLLAGLKILVLSTDVGGDGLLTVQAELERAGRKDLMDNVFEVSGLNTYQNVIDFFDAPEQFFPEIYTSGIDMVAWDGFTGFQLVHLMNHVGEDFQPPDTRNKEVSLARKEGIQLEQLDWNNVKNATVKALSKFLAFRDPGSDKPWHKYMTCLEAEKEKIGKVNDDEKQRYEEKKTILIQGAAKKLVEAAFDIVIECRSKLKRGDEGKTRIYEYQTACHEKLTAKSRGIILEPIEDADMAQIWNKIQAQLGNTKG